MKFSKLATIGAAVLLSGSVFASNMGFKLVYPLKAPAAGVHDGTNWVSIPYFNSFATQTANGMWTDMPTGKQNVFRYNPASGTTQRWAGGGFGQTDFAVTAGEAYLVRMTADANWTIVGSHDNALAINLKAPSAGVHDGTNWVSIPYHTTAAAASGIWNNLPAGKQNIFRYNPASGTTQRWAGGGFGQTDFTVTIGEAYLIRMTADASWTPAHY